MAMVTEYDWESDTLTTHPTRQAFREAVAQVAERAKAILPAAVNGRVESAVKLVLAGDVFFKEDGTIEVGSASHPETVYTLCGHACNCQDFTYGKAPEGWCQHRIAAGIAKRVQEVLAQPPAAVTPAIPSQPAPSAAPLQGLPAAAPALPEAPASVNVRLQIAGREVQWTLRDSDETRLAARLETLLARYPQPRPRETGPVQEVGWCAVHNTEMTLNHKDGRQWWSHRTDQGWCKGRRR